MSTDTQAVRQLMARLLGTEEQGAGSIDDFLGQIGVGVFVDMADELDAARSRIEELEKENASAEETRAANWTMLENLREQTGALLRTNASMRDQWNAEVQRLQDGLRAILREHQESEGVYSYCRICAASDGLWPCATVLEARAALGEAE